MLKKAFLVVLTAAILCGGGLAAVLFWQVVLEPGDEITQENIQKILGRESQVFYSDAETKLGVFFDTAHRQYVNYDDIPKDFVNALVASEDNRFFSHFGFDIAGIARAMVKNIQAGRVVQGGSTLTQQTAKNLFKREDRSLKAKLKELLFALRLEYHYSKEKIFEFYANQFYVSGNGHGLGVAARYYFDKRPNQLSLVECAFIAGSVKRPNYYNPFLKKSEAGKELARKRSRIRLKYVLNKMRDLGMIDRFRYNESLAGGIQFNQGKVGYSLDYGMELVREAVSTTEVENALAEHGIDNIATSGIRIITTLDKNIQKSTLAILRDELSRLDVRLRGYDREIVQEEHKKETYTGDSQISEDSFHFGTIQEIVKDTDAISIVVKLDKGLGRGVIGREGLSRMVRAFAKYTKNRWTEPGPDDLEQFVAQLQTKDRVWVRARDRKENGDWTLDLEKYPEIQGGAIVLKNGAIRALAGGTENRFFNRAIQARRTMGSAFKPPVYAAALQLGWNSADLLSNAREVFVYHGMPYFPRPDHNSPYEQVSMSWAGVHSENLASVWLLAHLCDKLSPLQFRDLAEHLGLAPKVIDGQDEPYRSYRSRIRDRFGVVVNRAVLRQTAYSLALKGLETDFIFDNLEDEFKKIQKIPYGLSYDSFADTLKEEIETAKTEGQKNYVIKELELRLGLVSNTYLRLESLRGGLRKFKDSVEGRIEPQLWDAPQDESEPAPVLAVQSTTGAFVFVTTDQELIGLSLVSADRLRVYLKGLNGDEQSRFWQEILLGGTLKVELFDRVAAQLDHEQQRLLQGLPYSFETLANIRDFRITVGLHYIVELMKQMGISSPLEPVLSFPLGSNVVSLLEATRMYEGLVTGHTTLYGTEEGDSDSIAIIDRIESAGGEVLYRPQALSATALDPETSLAVGGILENIITFGTGRLADKKVRLHNDGLDLAVPLLGKTGTANNYTNASFFGYLPGVTENGMAMVPRDGYAVGVYVGYDDNKPMRRRTSRIAGAAGALPAWCEVVNAILKDKGYLAKMDPVDLSFNGLAMKWPDLGQMNVGVDTENGGSVIEPLKGVSNRDRYEPSLLTFGTKSSAGRLVAKRKYKPFWEAASSQSDQLAPSSP